MITNMESCKITSYKGGIIKIKPYGKDSYQGNMRDIEGMIVDGHKYEFIQRNAATSEKSILLSIIRKNEKEYSSDNNCGILEGIIRAGGIKNYINGKEERRRG